MLSVADLIFKTRCRTKTWVTSTIGVTTPSDDTPGIEASTGSFKISLPNKHQPGLDEKLGPSRTNPVRCADRVN